MSTPEEKERRSRRRKFEFTRRDDLPKIKRSPKDKTDEKEYYDYENED